MKIANRTFIISGGSSGLGLETARHLCDSGAYVSSLDLEPPSEPHTPSDRVKFFRADVTRLSDIERAVAETVAWTAETRARLAGVICCAGVSGAAKIIDAHGEPHTTSLWDFTLAVNLTGSFNIVRAAVPHLIGVEPDAADGERGVIIFAASAAAFEGQTGQIAYAASKGALVSMTLPLARDLARYGVRVATIAPGAFESPMTRNMSEKVKERLLREVSFPHRFGQSHEFAQTVKWIVECAYVNGETVRLSGGGRLPGRL